MLKSRIKENIIFQLKYLTNYVCVSNIVIIVNMATCYLWLIFISGIEIENQKAKVKTKQMHTLFSRKRKYINHSLINNFHFLSSLH